MTYDIESIVIKVLANESGNLIIPLKGYSTSGRTNCPYNWKITVDDGAETSYSGTGGGTLTIATGLVAGSEHLVIIKPTTVDYQWARAFGTGEDEDVGKYIVEVVQDLSYVGYGISATNTGNYFRQTQYACSSVRKVANEGDIPNTVTTIGTNFITARFYSCKYLIEAPKEGKMGTGVTSIGDDYRSYMYQDCSSLTNGTIEQALPNVTTIGNSYRRGQYYNCPELIVAYDECLGDNVTTIGQRFRQGQYFKCVRLTRAAKEALSNSLLSIGHYFRYYQYDEDSSLVNQAEEVMPDSVTTIGNYFRQLQYGATGITKTVQEVMPKSLVSIGTNGRNNQYYSCRSLKEIVGEYRLGSNVSIGTGYRASQYNECPLLSKAKLVAQNGLSNYRSFCFAGDNNLKTITILGDVLDTPTNAGSINNDSIEKIYVDSSLVSAYQSSSNWSSIDDSKFFAIPSITTQVSPILLNTSTSNFDSLDLVTGILKTTYQSVILNGTENREWDNTNHIASLYVSGLKGGDISTGCCSHGDIGRDVDCWFQSGGKINYHTSMATLQDFKDWLVQEYTDNTPVIFIALNAGYNISTITVDDINTQDGENLIEITQGGPDVNDLQAGITVEQFTGGYTANMFNGEDYSVESNWIEISEQDEDEGGDVVGPNSSTDGNVALFDGITGKIIKDSGVKLSSKQDTLVSGTNIKTINGTTLLGSGDIAINSANTKIFYLSSTSDLTTAQAVVDWYIAGNTPLVSLEENGYSEMYYYMPQYVRVDNTANRIVFTSAPYFGGGNSSDYVSIDTLTIGFSNLNVATDIYLSTINSPGYLATDTNYSSPYVPQYNGSPATKKYVDDNIAELMGLGKFLSLRNGSTGQPISFPYTTPYTYTTGDYFLVEVVDATTNYRPNGSSYTGAASSTVETDEIEIGDVYIYDGTVWLLQSNHGKTVNFGNIAGSPYDNTNLSQALNAKQDALTAGANITIDPDTNEISANNTQYSSATSLVAGIVKLGNDTAISDTIAQPGTATGKTYPVQLNASGQMGVNVPWTNTTYGAGTGINIDANNNIQNTGVTSVNGQTGVVTVPEYTAGTGIEIGTEESDMKGPCASGFHVPTNTELENLRTIMTTTFGMGNMSFATYLKMPVSGYISSSGTIQGQGTMGNYWSCYMLNSGVSAKAITLYFGSDATSITSSWSDVGLPIRPFKNVSVTPDSTWTMIYDNQDGGGIYLDQTNGLISISGDGGTTWMTIADKNLGATSTDVTSSDSYGNYYQRGNNYGFSGTPTTTSSTLVDASSYGPGNYYSSSTFIVGAGTNWDTSNNTNLWGGDSQGTTIEQGGTTIINTGVLSINGQTGNVTVSEFTPSNAGSTNQILTKTANGYARAAAPASGIQNNTTGTTSTMSSIRVGTEAEYALITPVAGVEYHIY